MPTAQQGSSLAGSFRIFGVFGISVWVHWSWLLVAVIAVQWRRQEYDSLLWNAAEYVSLFVIVLLHEFGHALACRQVGGQANEIVLWPLGGIAFVQPPARPGAVLWSIAAGPLVNLILVPVTFAAYIAAELNGITGDDKGLGHFLLMLAGINLGLLIFNMLPIYPLDGGQIVQALLWFVIGRAKSLLVVSILGLIVGVAVIGVALWFRDYWTVVMAAFVAYRCWAGFQQARFLIQLDRMPRHLDAACPSCGAHPLQGPFWECDHCRARFDTFLHNAQCPRCGAQFSLTACFECQKVHPIFAWFNRQRDRRDV